MAQLYSIQRWNITTGWRIPFTLGLWEAYEMALSPLGSISAGPSGLVLVRLQANG